VNINCYCLRIVGKTYSIGPDFSRACMLGAQDKNHPFVFLIILDAFVIVSLVEKNYLCWAKFLIMRYHAYEAWNCMWFVIVYM